MPFKKLIRFCGVYLLVAIMLWVPTLTQAEMLSTQKTLQSLNSSSEKREWLTSIFHRQEAQEQLEQHGVSQAEALNRVNSMTDDEVASVINQIEEYVAAGDPVWKDTGQKDSGYIFAIIVGALLIICLAVCLLAL